MVRRRYSKQQYWEGSIIAVIVLLVLYRLALVYDYIPDKYQPSTMFFSAYDATKRELAVEAVEPTMLGHSAKWALDNLKDIEDYLYARKVRYQKAEAAAKRCQENMVFRFFMYMDDEDNYNCTPSNMRLNEEMKAIHENASKKGTQKGTQQGTIINVHGNTSLTPEMLTPTTTEPTPSTTPAVAPTTPPAQPVQPTSSPTIQAPAYEQPTRQPVSTSQPESVN